MSRSGSPYSLPRDANRVPVLGASSTTDGMTPVALYADPITHKLLTEDTGIINAINNIGGTTKYKTLIDKTTTTNVIYIGKADIGTATSADSWLITKVDKTTSPISITYADAGAFTATWNDRVTETYS